VTENSEFLHSFQRKLSFVTGKGGVGKSTIAFTLAKELEKAGSGSVLLVEIGGSSSIAHLANLGFEPGFKPQKTPYGFDIAVIDGASCLQEYLGHVLKISKLAQVFLENKLMKSLIPLAPGLDDLAILGQLTAKIRSHGPIWDYETIVVDSPSSGAFLSMIQAPIFLSEMVSRGPLNKQSAGIFKVLSDSKLCKYLFLTLPEVFPVDELIESSNNFSQAFEMPFEVVLNKMIPEASVAKSCSEKFAVEFSKKYRGQIEFQGKMVTKLKAHFSKAVGMKLDLSESLFKKDSSCQFLKI